MSETEVHDGHVSKNNVRGIAVLFIAAIIGYLLYKILPYADNTNKGLGLLAFIAILWLTEAVHITVTALLVPVLAVILGITMKDAKTGTETALTIKQALAPFADPTIYVFFGGFALATALHVQKLDRKIAMWLISLSGSHLGFSTLMIFAVTALLSMWISNTATAAMMLPLALGIMTHLDKNEDRGTFVFILLGIAYSASIGGLGTLVGSPPNLIAAQALDMDFAQWMKIGLPMMLVLWPLMLLVLYLVLRPNLNRKIHLETEHVPWNTTRIMTMTLFACTALAWIFTAKLKSWGLPVSDSWIALTAAVLVVILGLASWHEVAENTEWGVLLLFGGGLTLSAILQGSGAALALGNEVASVFGNAPHIVIIAVVAAFIVFLTEFTSNTASAALLVPVFATIAAQIGIPKEVLVIVIGIGASCAFMMPVATPPNALVFGTGLIRQREMIKTGFILSLGCIVILTLYTYFFLL